MPASKSFYIPPNNFINIIYLLIRWKVDIKNRFVQTGSNRLNAAKTLLFYL